jgi:DNA-binding HxlR family transcriptional regulator
MPKAKIKSAQGQKSKIIGSRNRMYVFSLIASCSFKPNIPLSFEELLRETGLSRPILAKHLEKLEKEGVIRKDIFKPDIASKLRKSKKVYVMTDQIDMFVKQMVEMGSIVPYLDVDEDVRKKIEEHYDAIAEIWSHYVKEREEWAHNKIEQLKKKLK